MGLWDKIKSVKNMVTGGGAQVFVELEEPSMDEPFKVHVKAIIKDADIKIDKVYLKIKAEETVIVEDIELVRRSDGEVEVYRDDLMRSIVTYQSEDAVSGAETLSANQEYHWEMEVELPKDASATYHGEYARHEWKFYAGLDAFGNDPDSGWVTFDIW